MNRGISVVDPRRLETTSPPVLVHIQAVSADGNATDMLSRIQLPAGAQRITLSYAGLGLSAPARIRYRYKLEGFDHRWSEPTNGREAVYTNLGPGTYRFRVIASNRVGVWNSREASAEFEIEPAIWQTLWFRSAAGLGCLALAIGLYRFRLHQLTQALNMRFEERLSERVRIAQDLHDTLLQGFLSASMQLHIAEKQLPEGSPGKPLVRRVVQLVRQVVEEGRDAVRGLRSPESGQEDLAEAFARVSDELGVQHNALVRVIVTGHLRPIHPIIRDDIYRIGREALVNAIRHSNATNIEIEMEYSAKHLRIVIRDNGTGIDAQVIESGRSGHWGLTGMRERAGRIGARIWLVSSAAAGTEVELSVPADVAFQSTVRRPRQWWNKKRAKGGS
ncbi:MAG: hypothetical protein H7039_10055 [Bryobacteraceae bacterium]|nr:hypothetical protein [Bryobacteraceae bacterium]